MGKIRSFRSHNFPETYFRHKNGEGWIDPHDGGDLYKNDASWKIVKGLHNPEGYSFESVNYPGHYLRHQNYLIFLHKDDGSELFKKDATFFKRKGLADPNGRSFEASNVPGHYIRHQNGRLRVSPDDHSAVFHADATWHPIRGFAHHDTSYLIKAAINDQLYLTAESEHEGTKIKLHPLGHGKQHFVFNQDGTIGLADHKDLVLDIDGNTGSKEGSHIILWRNKKHPGTDNQKWTHKDKYIISDLQTHLSLDVSGENRNAGAEIIAWHKKNDKSNNQQFYVVKA